MRRTKGSPVQGELSRFPSVTEGLTQYNFTNLLKPNANSQLPAAQSLSQKSEIFDSSRASAINDNSDYHRKSVTQHNQDAWVYHLRP